MNGQPEDSLDRDREIFLQALEKAQPGERSAFLDQACAGDTALRARLQELLQHHLEDDFLEAPAPMAMPAPAAAPAADVGTVIGHYKLLEKLGEGGCGVVYMAEQERPVRREVALKVIKLGMDTREVMARFDAERQALAMMDHPNIAKVLDAGATEAGRPYFVMELVRGIKITEFCDKNNLSTRDRLNLFEQVCRAVQHAHQKGIIHRDLKPANILVTLNDGVPLPKVIDFGIAKATQGRLTDQTLFTAFEQFIGTPAYMSPEQAQMSTNDVDTRSDIYSLGVLLYELLTGKTPFDSKELIAAGLDEMRRIIREKEPARPSNRLSTMTASDLTSVARRRQTEPPKLLNLVRGDLDWIVMKCLEKDRTRRYETANGLERDLERYLQNEPVAARPPSHLYRFGKVVRRNQLAFAAGAMVAMALLAGTALATWQALRASRERDAKELALREQTRLREKAQAAQREETLLREQSQGEAYASDMLLAQQAIAANNFGFARELLYRHRPQATSEKDSRGWEWRYLWQQCTSDVLAKVWQGQNKISDLKVSPDGKWLAVGQSSPAAAVSVLKFVDRTTTVLVTNIPARRATDVIVAFSPTAPLLAFCSSRYEGSRAQPTLHLWNLETGLQRFEMDLDSFCGGLEFSPDGLTLLVEIMDSDQSAAKGEVLLLRVPQGDLVWKCETPISNPCSGIAVDASFRAAAVGGDRLQVIDLSTGQVRWSVTNNYFWSAAFTRDGLALLAAEGSPSVLEVRDVNSGELLGRPVPLHGVGVGGLMLLPDGKTLLSNNGDASLQFLEVSDPTQPRALGRPLRGQAGGIGEKALSPRGETLLTGSWGGSVYAWDTTPPPHEDPLTVLTGVFAWQFAPDNRSILTLTTQGLVERREGSDFQSKRPLLDIGATQVLLLDRAEFSDDGHWLATSRDREVRVWDLRTASRAPRCVLPGMLVAHSFAAGGRLLVVFDAANESAQEWDLLTLQKLETWSSLLPRRPRPLLALSAGGKYRLNATFFGTEASLVEVGATQGRAWTNLVVISDANFSPNGRLFAVASMNGSTQVRESAGGQLVTTVGRRQFPTESVGFSADASRVVMVSEEAAALTLWDLGGRELLTLPTEVGVLGIHLFDPPRFSADDRLLGWRNSKNELYLWRALSWAEIEAVELHSQQE